MVFWISCLLLLCSSYGFGHFVSYGILVFQSAVLYNLCILLVGPLISCSLLISDDSAFVISYRCGPPVLSVSKFLGPLILALVLCVNSYSAASKSLKLVYLLVFWSLLKLDYYHWHIFFTNLLFPYCGGDFSSLHVDGLLVVVELSSFFFIYYVNSQHYLLYSCSGCYSRVRYASFRCRFSFSFLLFSNFWLRFLSFSIFWFTFIVPLFWYIFIFIAIISFFTHSFVRGTTSFSSSAEIYHCLHFPGVYSDVAYNCRHIHM